MGKEYYVSFIGEMIFDLKYDGWTAGRLEVCSDDCPYSLYEYRVFCRYTPQFNKFINAIDMKDFTKSQIEKIRKIIERKYCVPYDQG